ncbi:uncharacterized protein N0V89_007335 [Didymosphaeria variabile]|uniref:Methyltransferase domain-containing protein n=1 Tax=Didymosphaeria variabile TaxID=1932322 RepID=A0A9W8XJ80_9PLEO|nr:uncharacterized protein N0V89_007335 [Didymosphaeria variabile]KAJ4351989.1 hypothetical protein N0V89_007335 [Didymosphaeria variabile]
MSTTQQANDMQKNVREGWQDPSIAERYARAEAATRPYANIIIDKASLASNITDHNCTVNALDFGCGTGVVTAALYDIVPKEKWSNVKVLGGDISPHMLDYLRGRGEKNGWTGLTTQIVDGADIQLNNNQFTHIFANAIIFFLPLGALEKLFDLLQPGGFIGLTTWASFGWYSYVERAVNNMSNPPFLPTFSEIRDSLQKGNAWHEPAFVKQQLEETGLQDVELVVEKRNVECGTPAQFCESMMMPMTIVSGHWKESNRQETLKEVMSELKKVMIEEAGGEEGMCYMQMEGIVGVGWKSMKKAKW